MTAALTPPTTPISTPHKNPISPISLLQTLSLQPQTPIAQITTTTATTTMSTPIPLHPPSALPASGVPYSLTPNHLSSLSFLASSARSAAYAPYSRFRVGAAVLLSDDTLVSGANIENASYPVGTCAERVALGSAITNLLDHGQKGGKVEVGEVGEVEAQERAGVAEFQGGWKKGAFKALAVTSDAAGGISPCGMCRQFIKEFCEASMPVYMFDKEGNFHVLTVEQLLPLSFTIDSMPDVVATAEARAKAA
ncbi:hypothetical protein V500_07682 [Pseudogymnoascus sp. VKM F-4518 (FW-2643)]|nr:hypothetical protein V500_07682 [Pseudogymnoascus sp. VKM F-4518 (FW-2643)]